jgi:hypothetical protein
MRGHNLSNSVITRIVLRGSAAPVGRLDGPETLGMRPGAGAAIVQQIGELHGAYDLLLERTGIGVPEVEQLR